MAHGNVKSVLQDGDEIDIAESVANVLLERYVCLTCKSPLISFIESDLKVCSICGERFLEGWICSESDDLEDNYSDVNRVLIREYLWPEDWKKEVKNGLETGSSPEICGGI